MEVFLKKHFAALKRAVNRQFALKSAQSDV